MPSQEASPFCLVPLDIEGEWNRNLLENAAAMSGTGCIFASSDTLQPLATRSLDDVLAGFQRVIACETGRCSTNIFTFPAPREKTAIIVGNEERGIPKSVLRKADNIVSIPMTGTGMSSVNVAVSAAIVLYVLSKDMGRRKRPRRSLVRRDVDLMVSAPTDPHDLGSLLRSAWAFGWKRAFLNDPHGVWFSEDKKTVTESRAAARRFKNPLAVLPASKMDAADYDHVIVCDGERDGEALSRFRMPTDGHTLVVYGGSCWKPNSPTLPIHRVFVDHVDSHITGSFRHCGSILLSVISEQLGD